MKKGSKTVIFGRFWDPKITGFGPVLATYIRRFGPKTTKCVTCTLWGTTVRTDFSTTFERKKLGFLAIQKWFFSGFGPLPLLLFTENKRKSFWTRFSRFLGFFGNFGFFWEKPGKPEKFAAGI